MQHADDARLNESNVETGKSVIHNICDSARLSQRDPHRDHKRAVTKLRALLQRQADPNATTHLGETAFIIAAKSGFSEAFDVLLEYGANPSMIASSGMGVVAAAAATGSLRSLQKLYQLPVSVNWTDTFHFKPAQITYDSFENGHSGSNVLHAAAALKDSAVLRYLAAIPELSSKLDDPTELGFTPLHFSAEVGCEDNVTFLLQNGANVNALSRRGRIPPLHLAIWHGHANIVSILIDAGGALLSNGYGHSPEELVRLSHKEEVGEIIQTARSAIVKQIQCSSQLLEEFNNSILRGDVEACRAYIRRGALNLGLFTCGCTPLTYALCLGHLDVATLLLDEGASTAGRVCTTHVPQSHVSSQSMCPSAAYIAVNTPKFNSLLSNLFNKCLMFADHWAWSPVSLVHVAVEANDAAIDILISHLDAHWEWYA